MNAVVIAPRWAVVGLLAALSSLPAACSGPDLDAPGSGPPVAGEARQEVLGIERQIPVVALNALAESTKTGVDRQDFNRSLDKANVTFRGSGVQFIASELITVVAPGIDKNGIDTGEKVSWTDIEPIANKLGVASEVTDRSSRTLSSYMNELWRLTGRSEYLTLIAPHMPNRGTFAGHAPVTYLSQGDVNRASHKPAHELGHTLDVIHTHDISGAQDNCKHWDLVYYMGDGRQNVFFSSADDCSGFMQSHRQSDPDWAERLHKIDARRGDVKLPSAPFRVGSQDDLECTWLGVHMPKGTERIVKKWSCNDQGEQCGWKDPEGSDPAAARLRAPLSEDRNFKSQSECESFLRMVHYQSGLGYVGYYWSGDLEGNVRRRTQDKTTGELTLRLPCRGCTQSKEYKTGDAPIAAMSRFDKDGKVETNVMSYLTDHSPGAFISESQAAVIRSAFRYNEGGNRAFYGRRSDAVAPVMLDFDGDKRRDLVSWRPPKTACTASACELGSFSITYASNPSATTVGEDREIRFGIAGDVPIPDDYDGDGLADPAVFRPGGGLQTDGTSLPSSRDAYFLYCSSRLGWDCSKPVVMKWGRWGDVPLVGLNLDGDSRTGEISLYRPSTGTFYNALACLPSEDCAVSTRHSFALGNARSVLLPDYFDGDGKTDLAIYDPETAEFKVRLSGESWSTAHAYPMGDDLVPAKSGTTSARSIPYVLRQYTSRNGLRRRVLSLYDPGSFSTVTDWQWWSTERTITSCQFGSFAYLLVDGFDWDSDRVSDLMSLGPDGRRRFRSVAGRCPTQAEAPSTPPWASSLLTGTAVPDMDGDKLLDILVERPVDRQVTLIGSASSPRDYAVSARDSML